MCEHTDERNNFPYVLPISVILNSKILSLMKDQNGEAIYQEYTF